MNKTVSNILEYVRIAYKQASPRFHEHYRNVFKTLLISDNHTYSKALLNFSTSDFDEFVDECMLYRLGLTMNKPNPKEAMYNISLNAYPERYQVTIDSILDIMIYTAVPARLVNEIKGRLESHDIHEKILDRILKRIE